MFTTCTTEYPSSLIPVEKLINLRKAAAYRQAKQLRFVDEIYPEYTIDYIGALLDHQDDEYIFNGKIRQEQYKSKILVQDAEHVEFAAVSLLTPTKIKLLAAAAERIESRRRMRENYIKRTERSQVRDLAAARPLGRIGNNLDSYEKPVRERRYRIQDFIQKNNLVPGKDVQVERLNEKTGEIEYKTVYQKSAVCSCGTPITNHVHLKKNTEHGNVNIGGVATCGSVWACPVCRAKIVNQRAKDLNKIYTEGRAKGWEFHMITFTFSHGRADNLAKLYGSSTLGTGLSGAFTKFRQSRVWSKDLKPIIGYVGDIRSIETTWGWKNGFHPHIHMILISKNKFDCDKWEKKLLKQWQKNCKTSGIGIPNERGVKIDYVHTQNQVSYLAKWSVGSELSSESVKEGKAGNFSIAELELMLVDQETRTKNRMRLERAAGVLKAYYAAMHGQKQLVYGGLNTGWKKELNIDEIEDEGISDEEFQSEHENDLIIFDKKLYQELKRTGQFNLLIELLEPIPAGRPDIILSIAVNFMNRLKIPWENRMWLPETFHKLFN